jgi:hypothetical protein
LLTPPPRTTETPDYYKMLKPSVLPSRENTSKPPLPEKKNYLSWPPSESRLKKDSNNSKEKIQSKPEEDKTSLMPTLTLPPQMVPNLVDKVKLFSDQIDLIRD